MKRFIAQGLILCMLFSSFMTAGYASPKQAELTGSDIQGHWSEGILGKWMDGGILTGYPDGKLHPTQPISRAEFSMLLQRVFGASEEIQLAFKDVPADAWYASSLAAAFQAGFIHGYEDGTFRPGHPITRSETAVILSRVFQLSEVQHGMSTDFLEAVSDESEIRPYAKNAVKELIMAGVIKGYPDRSFRPDQFVTRAEAIAMLDRLAGTLYNKAVTDEHKEVMANAVVNTGDVVLRNKEITGNLYLTSGIGNGDITIENAKVAGVTFINGGGQDSIHIKNTNLAKVILFNLNHPIRVIVDDKSVIQQFVLRSPSVIQTGDGASISSLILQKGSSGSVIRGEGEISRVKSETVEIMVNDKQLEHGKEYVWLSDKEILIPANEKDESVGDTGRATGGGSSSTGNTSPSTGGDTGTRPTPPTSWPPVATQGSLPGTTKVTATAATGNRLAVLVSHEELPASQAGDTLMKSSLWIDSYQAGADISGVDPNINKYLGVYEVDQQEKIVRYQPIVLTEANIRPEAWNMVWNDEFDGARIDTSKWNYIQGGGGYGNNELQNYTDREKNARIENGHLVLEAYKEDYQGNAYTSAKLTTEGKGDWTYGRFEIRAQMPQGKGIWPAIWMMPTDPNLYSGWPASGEIDIMELLGHEPNKIYGTLHYGLPHEHTQDSYTLPDGATFADDFHTYAVEWEPGEIRFYIDGVLYSKQSNWFSKNQQEGEEYTYPAPFDRDFFLQLNVAVGGDWPGSPDSTTEFPQKMLVDYVRVYERDGHAYRQPVLPATKTVAIREPGEDGNYVENGTFEDEMEHWVFQPFAPPADLFGGAGSVSLDQGAVKVTIDQEGDVNYAIQLVQAGLPLIKGATYQLSFDAWSSGNRTMVASLSGPDQNYARYMDDKTVALTAERQSSTYTFVMNSDTDANARLEFNMGEAGTLPIWIDEVRLVKIADPDSNTPRDALPSGNLIYNGTFDQGKDRLGFWKINGPGSADASYHVGSAINDRKLYVKPRSAGQPDALTLSQDRLKLTEGKMYILSFSARAESSVSIVAQIGNEDQSNLHAEQAFTIGTDSQIYSWIFTMGPVNGSSNLEFGLGALTNFLELDNVSLKEMSPPVEVNGSKRIEAENYSDMKGVQKGDDGLSVGWIDPGDWMQYIVDVKKAGEYKIAYFVASGHEGGGSLTLLGKQGSVYTQTLPAGEINEDDADFKYTWNVANTGDWGAFKLMEQTIQLNEGIQTLQIYAPHVNVDYFILTDVHQEHFTGNLIRNGTFDSDVSEWQTYQSDNKSDKLSIAAKDGAMHIQLPEIMPESWNQQVYQDGLTLEQGKVYSVTFDVYSTVDRPIQLGIGFVEPSNNYAYTDFLNGNKPTIWLTNVKQQLI
ncbi:carbohydrate binding domain-containing protein [Paenibacillus lentus]|uniref:carbohydrate binding domain-containing protein n=1 Tax=Paenibacillus lentus TaxID=1338368 RepID=UPI0013DDB1AD|nr:carbohydrate binding domain-containing protein [Paenibacillus lentus]